MTKNKFIDELIGLQKTTNEYMSKFSIAIEKLNDSNLLHHQAIDTNTRATRDMTVAIKSQTSAIQSQQALIKWVVIALVLAIILLAGAEKILKFIPPAI
ncbi:MAG: hypothetical protein M1445_08480 [Bacteroidetes bacterium]|nr:hypothetical protein [Bacteroidota bacterium]